MSLVRCNSDSTLGHVDDRRRLNAALTRANRALVVNGNANTQQAGYESCLRSFIRHVYECGVVIEVPRKQRRAAL